MKEPFIAYSEITNEIYIVYGRDKKVLVTNQVLKAMEDTGRLPSVSQTQDGDAISREEVLLMIDSFKDNYGSLIDLAREIRKLPSVSQTKTGHWISREGKGQVLPFWGRYECSECGECAENSSFCPNCGTKMGVE